MKKSNKLKVLVNKYFVTIFGIAALAIAVRSSSECFGTWFEEPKMPECLYKKD